MDLLCFSDLNWMAWATMAIIALVFAFSMRTRYPADFVFIGGMGALLVLGILKPNEALKGFSASGMITVGFLYVVVAGFKSTGGLSWVATHLLGRPERVGTALINLVIPVSFLSAFLNNTPVVALFIPVVKEWSRKIGISASRLLIPLSYASILGGICTLIGTSTNLVVHGLLQERAGFEAGLGLFSIAKLGVPCAVAGIGFMVLMGRKLLPDREVGGGVLRHPREYTLELAVDPQSSCVGKTIEQADLRHLPSAFLAEIIRRDHILPAVDPSEVLQPHDRLVFVGGVEALGELLNRRGLTVQTDRQFERTVPKRDRRLVEVVVSSSCPLVDLNIRDAHFREVYNAVVLAACRNGARVQGRLGDMVLKPGDTLLIECHAGFIPRQRESRDFFLISEVEQVALAAHEKAPMAVAILVGMILLATFGWFGMDMLKSSMLAAALMVVSGCCTFRDARRSVEWNVLLVIASALSLGRALELTGAAEAMAGFVMGLAGHNAWGTLLAVYVCTTLFTEVITNNAAAALVFPIAMSAAAKLGVNPIPFVMCIMVAASASFATPIGYQTNLMVYGAGGYKFSDFMRLGLPMNILLCLVSVLLAPLIWPF